MSEVVPRRAWRYPLLYMAGIYGLSSLPGRVTHDPHITAWLPGGVQDWLHVPLYFGLALALRYALGTWLSAVWASLATLLIATAYGASDEWHQLSVPGRTASLEDLARDVLGIVCALAVYTYFRSRARATKIL